MGTRFELVLAGGARDDLLAAGETALEEIAEWHRRLSRFEPDSLVSHINRTAHDGPVRLDRETFALFADALAVWRDSEGAFDIAVAPLMARHGFPASAAGGGSADATSASIALDDDAWTIRFTRPGVSLDLGGIGKGHALDCAAAVLRAHGVARALVHGGTSSVVAIGAPQDASGWRVAVGADGGVITLRDAALAVSDPRSQRSALAAGHIVDPRTTRPIAGAGRVAVVGPSARLADAWATALVVLGSTPLAFPPEYRATFLASTSTSELTAQTSERADHRQATS